MLIRVRIIAVMVLFLALISTAFIYAQEPGADPQVTAERSEDAARQITEVKTGRKAACAFFSLDELKKKAADDKKIFFSLAAGLQSNMGNTDSFSVNGSTSFRYDNGYTSLILSYETFYGENDSIVIEHRGLGIVNLDHFVHPRVEIFAFSSAEYNEMSGLSFRNNSGAGAKIVFFRNRYLLTDLSGAPIYQYEKYSSRAESHEARASLRFRLKITPLDWLLLQFTAFYIPTFYNGEDYRFNIDSFAQIRITSFFIPGIRETETGCGKSGLYFIGGYRRDFNNDAPRGTEKTDHLVYLKVSLMI